MLRPGPRRACSPRAQGWPACVQPAPHRSGWQRGSGGRAPLRHPGSPCRRQGWACVRASRRSPRAAAPAGRADSFQSRPSSSAAAGVPHLPRPRLRRPCWRLRLAHAALRPLLRLHRQDRRLRLPGQLAGPSTRAIRPRPPDSPSKHSTELLPPPPPRWPLRHQPLPPLLRPTCPPPREPRHRRPLRRLQQWLSRPEIHRRLRLVQRHPRMDRRSAPIQAARAPRPRRPPPRCRSSPPSPPGRAAPPRRRRLR
mmetsp:Transcript_2926/g.9139  ORF Transcript_2926/g.9139 Transcript_2926/m.9139 type:complete len:253 (+) Transcript_2926:1375-2133(+)